MRIGIAVKPGLTAARETLIGLEQRLRDRGVDAVWTADAAALLPPSPTGVDGPALHVKPSSATIWRRGSMS